MSDKRAWVSPIRSVMLMVQAMEEAISFYRDGLGMHCIERITRVPSATVEFWDFGGRVREMALMAQPDEPYGRVELVCLDQNVAPDRDPFNGRPPVRDQSRAYDYGLLTLNLRTADIKKALDHLEQAGAKCLADPVSYEYQPGIFLYEAMVQGLEQERYTVLQVGDTAEPQGHVVGDVIATVGTVVPSLADARRFYGDVLGLTLNFELDQTGPPFSTMLGMAANTRLRMNMFTADRDWTGKLETLRVSKQGGRLVPRSTTYRMQSGGSGYGMMSMVANDIEGLSKRLGKAEITIIRDLRWIERPFTGRVQAMLVAAPGGVPLEIIGAGAD